MVVGGESPCCCFGSTEGSVVGCWCEQEVVVASMSYRDRGCWRDVVTIDCMMERIGYLSWMVDSCCLWDWFGCGTYC